MSIYIDNFMLGPITGTNSNFASKYIVVLCRLLVCISILWLCIGLGKFP